MTDITTTASAADSSAGDLDRILLLQKAAFLKDGTPDLATRVGRLDRLASLLVNNKDEIADVLSADFGNRSRESSLLLDVAPLLEGIEYNKAHLADWMYPEVYEAPITTATARVEFQPKGVIGIISPWNFPLQLAFSPLIGVFAAGNRAMLKPSELTTQTSALMKRLVAERFDETELAVFTGGPDVGAAFTALAFDHLVFTGGTSVAQSVARAAAANLVPLTLELGGKSPVIIGESADLDRAAQRIMTVKTMNAGQICLAPDYVFVPTGKEAAFVKAATAAVTTMFPTLKENPDYTSIINQRHFERLTGLLDDARAKGAQITTINPASEDLSDRSAHRLAPTLVLRVTDEMRILQEEIFGPLLPVVSYASIEEALGRINARPRPLALYYFGDSPEEERRVLDGTTSGAVTINDCMSHATVESLPFGGIGDSGMGAYHGRQGFRSFSHAKAIYRQADDVPAEALLRPPYGEATRSFLDQAITGRG